MKLIILHGLYMHGVAMRPLSQKLKACGYQTQTVSYNSVAINEEKVFATIDRALSKSQTNVLVGHSLGGLIIKHYLASRQPNVRQVSHVVAIGSPLRGASIVSRIQDLGMGSVLGNASKFGLEEHHDVWRFPQKLGSIAGTMPLGARALLMMSDPSLSDGTVTVEETKIEGMTDHIEVHRSHTSMIYSSFVPKQIDQFIRYSQFEAPFKSSNS
ncbi:triacylglycerol lipase [Vibrio ostreicida]|uniref:Triacylglycerol lipase n=1 Tax=Vibrio ostreicida TaxID=526588 RepID=A0ABT8BXP0_9VIBR|nr:cobinamide adenolsyltransferase [Vibrio ostreicida]MDN3611068.1 triacylglycerol lipase [Vibrio ostreicida]MDN3611821.1 triacylglycerol lipase [Vibrio ostreicida]NPD09634.1 triacylglycerol lipase [Vibrio ostreicida]